LTLDKVVRVNMNEGRVRAVFRFDMRLPNLYAIFHKNWEIMVSEEIRLKSVFPQSSMVCYTREKNIKGSRGVASLAVGCVLSLALGLDRCRSQSWSAAWGWSSLSQGN
jgi:hypothetical protein